MFFIDNSLHRDDMRNPMCTPSQRRTRWSPVPRNRRRKQPVRQITTWSTSATCRCCVRPVPTRPTRRARSCRSQPV